MLVRVTSRLVGVMRLSLPLIFLRSVPFSVNGQVSDVPTTLDSTVSPTETSPFTIDVDTTKIHATGVEGFDDERSCFLNTTLVYEATNSFGAFVRKRAVLCPDTTFDMDFMQRIQPVANTDYFCGDDGKVSNNCLLVGGTNQIFDLDLLSEGPSDFVVFQGITFGDVGNQNAFLINGGDIVFRDCYWTSAEHISSVYTDHTNENVGRLKVSFYNNVWDGNTYVDSIESQNYYPLIEVTGLTDVVVENCTFSDNKYSFPDKDEGYAIGVRQGSTLSITNSCFIGNEFKGEGVIFVEDMSATTWDNIYVDDSGGGVRCQFIYNNSTKECVDADLYECPQDHGEGTPATTPFPTASPTSEPSSGDGDKTSAAEPLTWCSFRFLLFSSFIGLLLV